MQTCSADRSRTAGLISLSLMVFSLSDMQFKWMLILLQTMTFHYPNSEEDNGEHTSHWPLLCFCSCLLSLRLLCGHLILHLHKDDEVRDRRSRNGSSRGGEILTFCLLAGICKRGDILFVFGLGICAHYFLFPLTLLRWTLPSGCQGFKHIMNHGHESLHANY